MTTERPLKPHKRMRVVQLAIDNAVAIRRLVRETPGDPELDQQTNWPASSAFASPTTPTTPSTTGWITSSGCWCAGSGAWSDLVMWRNP